MNKSFERHSEIELYQTMQNDPRNAEYAFEELYERLSVRVYRYCQRVLGEQSLAEDAFQETFMRLYQSRTSQRDIHNVAAYALKIARNVCLNAKKSKYYGLASLEDFRLSDVDKQYERKELEGIVKTAVECLPLDYREAFVLREYDGLGYPEIAEVLDITVATVKIRIYRARKRLHKILSPYVDDFMR